MHKTLARATLLVRKTQVNAVSMQVSFGVRAICLCLRVAREMSRAAQVIQIYVASTGTCQRLQLQSSDDLLKLRP